MYGVGERLMNGVIAFYRDASALICTHKNVRVRRKLDRHNEIIGK